MHVEMDQQEDNPNPDPSWKMLVQVASEFECSKYLRVLPMFYHECG